MSVLEMEQRYLRLFADECRDDIVARFWFAIPLEGLVIRGAANISTYSSLSRKVE